MQDTKESFKSVHGYNEELHSGQFVNRREYRISRMEHMLSDPDIVEYELNGRDDAIGFEYGKIITINFIKL